jgi:hypothetical protein
MKAFVYVISGEHGRQKIGCSDNPKQRIKELQTGSPYPLKFEFVGEAENNSAGQIEVEAHFMLNPHKAPGGDEWFVVPPDVAITAVMAAAHRLGYRLRPVDVGAIAKIGFGVPNWEKWLKVAVAVAALYPVALLILAFDRGEIHAIAFVVTGLALIGLIKLAQMIAVRAGRALIAASDFMAPSSPDHPIS